MFKSTKLTNLVSIEIPIKLSGFQYQPCQACGSTEEVELENSRTCYVLNTRTRFERVLEPEQPDPNAPIPLCRPCAVEHHENWNDQWNDYYAGLR